MMLTRMCLNKFAGLILLLVPLAAPASQATQRFAVSTQQVMDALTTAGLSASPAQVEFLSTVNTTSDDVQLHVVNTVNQADGSATVKLRCQNNHQCLPFYVLLRASKARSVKSGAGNPGLQLASDHELIAPPDLPRVMRAGDAAILTLENKDFRIRIPVVCLQDGTQGERIRVASKDHRRFFEGEIVGTGVLKGSL